VAESDSVKRADKAPISTHPAFPAIVALWFAALLGLGSMVLPIALFENLSTVTGIAALMPSAEPPLGFTARAVIALAGAFGGAAIGLLLARQVARSHTPKQRSLAPAEARECRPISAHDELGEEGLGLSDSISTGRKRRSLAHGRDWISPEAVPETNAAMDNEPGDSAEAHLPTQDQTMTEGQSFHPGEWDQADEPEVAEADDHFIETPAPQLSVVEPDLAGQESHPPLDDRPLEELGLVQLAGRLGAAIEKRRMLKALRSAGTPAAAPTPAPDAPVDFDAAEPEDAARAIASFFGPGEAVAPPPQPSEELEAEPLHTEVPASMRALQVEGEHEDEDEEDDAFVGSFSLPLTRLANGHGLSAGEAIDEEDSPDADETDEGEYSSLLAMKNPFSRHEEFVRIDEPEMEAGDFEPTVTFPAAAPAAAFEAPADFALETDAASPAEPFGPAEKPMDSAGFAARPSTSHGPADADRDLRAALATLQRMNGAA
jgi:hypothetical protein